MERVSSFVLPVEHLAIQAVERDVVDEAKESADTQSLGYFIRKLASTRAEDQDVVLTEIEKSMHYEVFTNHEAMTRLRCVHMSLMEARANAPNEGEAERVSVRVRAPEQLPERPNDPHILQNTIKGEMAVLRDAVNLELAAENQRGADLGVESDEIDLVDKIHPVLYLFKLKLDLRAIRLQEIERGSLPADRKGNAAVSQSRRKEIRDDDFVVFEDRGVLGDSLAHLCLRLWGTSEVTAALGGQTAATLTQHNHNHPHGGASQSQGEGAAADTVFNPDWAKRGNFARKDYDMPAPVRLLLWMISYYGRDVINNPCQVASMHRAHKCFEGQTLLHLAVVRRDFELVAFLVRRGADVRARAVGSFFTQHHFGEFPLCFAAAVGSVRLVDLLLKDYGDRLKRTRMCDAVATIEDDSPLLESLSETTPLESQVDPVCDKDMAGNTVLHVCVLRGHMHVYHHLVTNYQVNEFVVNNNKLTPLTLAAFLGKVEAFQAILKHRAEQLWVYGGLTSYADPMTEHESALVKLSAPSTLQVIVQQNQVEMMADPFLSKLVAAKWELLRWNFWGLFLVFFANCTLFLFITLDNGVESISSKAVVVVCSVLYFLSSVDFFIKVVRDAFESLVIQLPRDKSSSRIVPRVLRSYWTRIRPNTEEGKNSRSSDNWRPFSKRTVNLMRLRQYEMTMEYSRRVVSLLKETLLEILTYCGRSGLPLLWLYCISSIYLTMCHEDNNTFVECDPISRESTVVLQLVAFLSGGLFMVWFFLAGVQVLDIGLYVLIVWRCFWKVICPFAVVYVFLLMPTAVVLHIQFRDDKVEEFTTIVASMEKMFAMALGGMGFADFDLGKNNDVFPWLPAVIMLIYTLVIYILLMNLLIAILSSEIEQIRKVSTMQVRMQQARIVLWIERLPLPWLRRQFLLIGEHNPTPEPFYTNLQAIARTHDVVYQSFNVFVTLCNWENEWRDEQTVLLKRMILDACMRKPRVFNRKKQGMDPGLDIEFLKIVMLDSVLERYGRESVGSSASEQEQLCYVTDNLDQQKAMLRKQQKIKARRRSGLALDGDVRCRVYRDQLAGLPLWRNGCVVRGGGLRDVHRTPNVNGFDFVTLELKLHVPFRKSKRIGGLLAQSLFRWVRCARVEPLPVGGLIPVDTICNAETIVARLMGNDRNRTFKTSVEARMRENICTRDDTHNQHGAYPPSTPGTPQLQKFEATFSQKSAVSSVVSPEEPVKLQVFVEVVQESYRGITEVVTFEKKAENYSPTVAPVAPPRDNLSEMTWEEIRNWRDQCDQYLWKFWRDHRNSDLPRKRTSFLRKANAIVRLSKHGTSLEANAAESKRPAALNSASGEQSVAKIQSWIEMGSRGSDIVDEIRMCLVKVAESLKDSDSCAPMDENFLNIASHVVNQKLHREGYLSVSMLHNKEMIVTNAVKQISPEVEKEAREHPEKGTYLWVAAACKSKVDVLVDLPSDAQDKVKQILAQHARRTLSFIADNLVESQLYASATKSGEASAIFDGLTEADKSRVRSGVAPEADIGVSMASVLLKAFGPSGVVSPEMKKSLRKSVKMDA